jgi:hypothetical protein
MRKKRNLFYIKIIMYKLKDWINPIYLDKNKIIELYNNFHNSKYNSIILFENFFNNNIYNKLLHEINKNNKRYILTDKYND